MLGLSAYSLNKSGFAQKSNGGMNFFYSQPARLWSRGINVRQAGGRNREKAKKKERDANGQPALPKEVEPTSSRDFAGEILVVYPPYLAVNLYNRWRV